MAPERDFDEAHRAGEREADDMERRGGQLGEQIEEARSDWESKKGDQSVPGAQPEDED